MDKWAFNHVRCAGSSALSTLRNLQQTIEWLEKAIEADPECEEKLRGLVRQNCAMEDVARSIESAIAEILSEVRAGR